MNVQGASRTDLATNIKDKSISLRDMLLHPAFLAVIRSGHEEEYMKTIINEENVEILLDWLLKDPLDTSMASKRLRLTSMVLLTSKFAMKGLCLTENDCILRRFTQFEPANCQFLGNFCQILTEFIKFTDGQILGKLKNLRAQLVKYIDSPSVKNLAIMILSDFPSPKGEDKEMILKLLEERSQKRLFFVMSFLHSVSKTKKELNVFNDKSVAQSLLTVAKLEINTPITVLAYELLQKITEFLKNPEILALRASATKQFVFCISRSPQILAAAIEYMNYFPMYMSRCLFEDATPICISNAIIRVVEKMDKKDVLNMIQANSLYRIANTCKTKSITRPAVARMKEIIAIHMNTPTNLQSEGNYQRFGFFNENRPFTSNEKKGITSLKHTCIQDALISPSIWISHESSSDSDSNDEIEDNKAKLMSQLTGFIKID